MQYLSGLELAKRDPDWTKKIALCGVLMLSAMCIPFFGQFALNGYLSAMMQRTASALTKMDHVVLTRVDPGSMTRITRGAAALAA